jgi:hypothetical protein
MGSANAIPVEKNKATMKIANLAFAFIAFLQARLWIESYTFSQCLSITSYRKNSSH